MLINETTIFEFLSHHDKNYNQHQPTYKYCNSGFPFHFQMLQGQYQDAADTNIMFADIFWSSHM